MTSVNNRNQTTVPVSKTVASQLSMIVTLQSQVRSLQADYAYLLNAHRRLRAAVLRTAEYYVFDGVEAETKLGVLLGTSY